MAANDSKIACATDLTFDELLASAIGKDASGNPYLRLYATTNVSGSKYFDCGGIAPDEANIKAALKGLFALDANGDVALRTGTAS
ncbi:MAG: hypothetical protein V4549_06410 [Bacteroidota bacterium]